MRSGVALRMGLPSTRFRRTIGAWAGQTVNPEGVLVDKSSYEKSLSSWIPSAEDRAFVHSLMQRVVEPGKIAGWVAPPDRGINNLPVDYEYVKLN